MPLDYEVISYRTPACDNHLDENESDECPWCCLEKVRELQEYCQRTMNIHPEATNIHFVADIYLRLQAILENDDETR